MEQNNTFTQELDKFDPTTEALRAAAADAQAITVTDIKDKTQIAVVSDKRKELKTMRVNITKTGKMMREDAQAFTKAVIAKEKELVGMIEPEEQRLMDIENQHKHHLLMEARAEQVPARKQMIFDIDPVVVTSDEHLLSLDDASFEAYKNEVMAAKIEKDRVAAAEEKRKADEEAAAKQKAIDEANEKAQREINEERARVEAEAAAVEAEKQRLAHEAEVKAAEEKAAAEAKVKAEREAEEKAQREKEAAEQVEKDRIAAEEEARKKAEADARFQEWKNAAGFDDTTDTIEKDGETYIIWRKVSVFNTVFNTSSHDDAPVDNPA